MLNRAEDWPRIPWWEAESERLRREQEAMASKAPDMAWADDLPAKGWRGMAPEWPMPRPRPQKLDKLLRGGRLELEVTYSQGFPAEAPRFLPLSPEPEPDQRFREKWHLNSDGSLCLLRRVRDWDERATAADLVEKAASWFIEYRAVEEGLLEEMSGVGMFADAELDQLIEEL
jgi:hypothetical protein